MKPLVQILIIFTTLTSLTVLHGLDLSQLSVSGTGLVTVRSPKDKQDIPFHDGFQTDITLGIPIQHLATANLKLHFENSNISNGLLVNDDQYSNLTLDLKTQAGFIQVGELDRLTTGHGLLISDEEYYGLLAHSKIWGER